MNKELLERLYRHLLDCDDSQLFADFTSWAIDRHPKWASEIASEISAELSQHTQRST